MADTICIFEDPMYTRLLPLVYTRPVYDLRCGIFTLREKIERAYPKAKVALLCRPYLADVVKQQSPRVQVNEVHGGNCLLINGRVLADNQLAKKIPLKGNDAVFLSGNTVVAVRMNAGKSHPIRHDLSAVFDVEHFSDLEKIRVDVAMIEYSWHLVNNNAKQIIADFQPLAKKKAIKSGKIYAGVHLLNKKDIIIGEGAVLKPGVVLDAEKGPIFIGRDAQILPNAAIEGPAFIGAGSLIKIGAKIYEGTTIGEMCKVGGEVEASIIHSYSNKQHDGFLGHAYIGMWCNLGADTNNSDLKNNYGSVRVVVNGVEVDSGSRFVGVTMGDHAKCGINTMFNTGAVVGVMSNVFGPGFPPKSIPSFSWGGSEGIKTYEIERALEVARRVMARREVNMSDSDELLLRKVFEMTKVERQ